MTILEQVTAEWKTALKEKQGERAKYLSFIRSRIQDVGKNSKPPRDATESDAITAIRKLINENGDTLAQAGDKIDPASAALLAGQNAILESFLPAQLSEDELRAAIANAIGDQPKSMKLMKVVMGELQEKYEGQYDNKLASSIAKAMLTG